MSNPLDEFARWIVDLDIPGNEERRTITMTKIIARAEAALEKHYEGCICVHPSHCRVHRGKR